MDPSTSTTQQAQALAPTLCVDSCVLDAGHQELCRRRSQILPHDATLEGVAGCVLDPTGTPVITCPLHRPSKGRGPCHNVTVVQTQQPALAMPVSAAICCDIVSVKTRASPLSAEHFDSRLSDLIFGRKQQKL